MYEYEDDMSEADYLFSTEDDPDIYKEDKYDTLDFVDEFELPKRLPVDNSNRYRCKMVGCNPKLYGEDQANSHRESTGHKVYKWGVRSEAGKRKAKERSRSGYYRKYNRR